MRCSTSSVAESCSWKIRRRVEQPVVEQLVEQQRVAGDERRRPARGADDARDALQRLRMLRE
jgi:hypothetical protein